MRVKRALLGVIERDELRLHYQPLVRLQHDGDDPTGHGCPRRDHRGARGPPSLGRSDDRHSHAERVHRHRRGDRRHRPYRALGRRDGLSPATRVAGAAGQAGTHDDGQPLGPRARPAQIRGARSARPWRPRASRPIRSSSRSRSTPSYLTAHVSAKSWTSSRAAASTSSSTTSGPATARSSYLRSLPIDGLKIAQPFVRSAVGDEQATALLRAIIEVGAALGAVVVAEGIETEEELELVRSLGCHLGQGFILSPPIEAGDAERLLQTLPRPWDAILEAAPPSTMFVGSGAAPRAERLPIRSSGTLGCQFRPFASGRGTHDRAMVRVR